MNSRRILYGTYMSPAVRAVRMTLEELQLNYEFKFVDVYAGETRTPEFLKKNPQHTVPTLEDIDGKCIWDSHAIVAYLVRKYGKDDALYPKGFYERAVIDQRLHYENGTLFMDLVLGALAPFISGELKQEQLTEVMKRIDEQYALLEIFLGDHKFIAGNSLTIADLSIVSSLSSIATFKPIEPLKYPKLNAWYGSMKELPYYEGVNAEGLKQLSEKLQQAQQPTMT